MTIIAIFF